MKLIYILLLLLQRGGAASDMYIEASESNYFLGTVGSLIVGAIIWWFIIKSSDKKD
jgi:hypothetical protein